jgi:hypothetical protein
MDGGGHYAQSYSQRGSEGNKNCVEIKGKIVLHLVQ